MTDQTVNIMRGLKTLGPDQLVELHNHYCTEYEEHDAQFLPLDEGTLQIYYSGRLRLLIDQISGGCCDSNDSYFRVNVFDEFMTFSPEEAVDYLDFEKLAEFVGQDEYLLIDLLGDRL